jgi:nitrogen-specific signal transduction histidine kinase
MTASGYALLGLTAVVAVLVAILAFAVLRFMSAARAMTRPERRISTENALLSAALEESVTRLKAKERAMAARADASERLSSEIISSLAAGLMVVGLKGDVQIINPAGRRLLCVPEEASPDDYRRLIGEPALSRVIDECLSSGVAVVRRTVHMPDRPEGATRLGVTVSPLFDEHGKLHGAVCLFSDLTAVQQLEEQLRLKESLATVGELTAGIAHEFRNGLATIHGYGKLLDPAALPQVYRPYVEGIRAETQSLTKS